MKKATKNHTALIRQTRTVLLYTAIIAAAVWLLGTDTAERFILSITPLTYVAEFIAGALYTSLFTVPLSLALLVSLSEVSNPYFIAVVGGLGAVFGDFVLMNVITKFRQTITIHKDKKPRFTRRLPKPLLIVAGIICLVFPVPDEIAMALLGISKINIKTFILVVYPAKALGIFLVTLSASSVL